MSRKIFVISSSGQPSILMETEEDIPKEKFDELCRQTHQRLGRIVTTQELADVLKNEQGFSKFKADGTYFLI